LDYCADLTFSPRHFAKNVQGDGKALVRTYEVEDADENAVMSDMENIRKSARVLYCADEAMLFVRNLGLAMVYIVRNKGRHLYTLVTNPDDCRT